MNVRSRLGALAIALALASSACASDREQSSGDPAASDCSSRADALAAGFAKTTPSGARFTLRSMVPLAPVQSAGPPGNSWAIEIRDANAAPLSGALNVTTFMPDHGHAGPPTIGIESSPGVYEIDELVFPMPALYAVTLTLTPASAERKASPSRYAWSPRADERGPSRLELTARGSCRRRRAHSSPGRASTPVRSTANRA